MIDYIFKTSATMKEYNNKKWWIDSDIIREIRITADNLKQALEQYRETVINKYCIDISHNALKNKSPMYIDDRNGNVRQVGYIITGKTEFDKGDYTGYSTQYIDLWVTVLTVINTEFPEEV